MGIIHYFIPRIFHGQISHPIHGFNDSSAQLGALPHSTQALPGRAQTSLAQLKTWARQPAAASMISQGGMERQQKYGYIVVIIIIINSGYNDGYNGYNMLIIMVIYIYIYVCIGAVLNWGYASWMVYKGKSHLKLDDTNGVPLFQETSYGILR